MFQERFIVKFEKALFSAESLTNEASRSLSTGQLTASTLLQRLTRGETGWMLFALPIQRPQMLDP